MNKRLVSLLSFAAGASILVAACTPAPAAPAAPAATTAPAAEAPAATEAPAAPAAAKLRIKLVLNGTLGDKSFFDSAQRGLDMMKSELGYEVKTVELGYDRNKWEPGLEDAAAADDYDVLVAGTFDMSPYIQTVAPKYPNKKFWTFDAGPEFDKCTNKCANVYSIYFKQNEGSYLLGIVVGNLLKDGKLPGVEGKDKVGAVVGADFPGLNDFIVGFKQGVREAGLKDENVLVQYVGGDNPFSNPAKGKEIAKSMFDQGAAMVWGVAGSTGLGVFEAAVEAKAYSLGVDSDQYLTVPDPGQKATIITSMLKNVDAGLFRAAQLDAKGELKYGAGESVGIAIDAVGVADNENYQKFVSKEIQDLVKAAAEKVKKGETTVETAL